MVESDEELVRRVRHGERNQFSHLVERYERPALLAARSILGCPDEARDAVQDAFVTAFVNLNRLWTPSRFGAWFLKIVRRHALERRRRLAARSRHLAAIVAERGATPTISADSPIDAAALIARLPEPECVVVSLRHLNELPVVEIARITGRPVGTVTKQLSRAYARMRSWLTERS